jgi:hypothetical protein
MYMKHVAAGCGSRSQILLMMVVLMGAALLVTPGVLPVAHAQACCQVTALSGNKASAKDTRTGASFQFTVTERVSLRVGDPVYANFSKKEVSCNGSSICGTITAISPGVAPAPVTPTTAATGAVARAAAGTASRAPTVFEAGSDGTRGGAAATASVPSGPRGMVVLVDRAKKRAVAEDKQSGRLFEFTASPAVLEALRPNQPIFVNLSGKLVSLDGRTVAGEITGVDQLGASPQPGGADAVAASSSRFTCTPGYCACRGGENSADCQAMRGACGEWVGCDGLGRCFCSAPLAAGSLRSESTAPVRPAVAPATSVPNTGGAVQGAAGTGAANMGLAPAVAQIARVPSSEILIGGNLGVNTGATVTAVSGPNLITAQTTAGAYFVFSLNPSITNPFAPSILQVGEKVNANFTTNQVSLDNAAPVGTIKYLCAVPGPGQPCPPTAASCASMIVNAQGPPGCPEISATVGSGVPTSCQSGYYGSSCMACPANCSASNPCSQGITGTGQCQQ